MKAVVAAFNQEKALVGAFSVITNLRMQLFEALLDRDPDPDPPVVEGDEDDVVDHPELGPEPARRPRAPHEGATVQPHCGSYSYNWVKFPSRQVP